MRRTIYARDRGQGRRCGRAAPTVHHLQHWARGGATRVVNGVSLCFDCHTSVHEGGWSLRRRPDGTLVCSRPCGQLLERPPP